MYHFRLKVESSQYLYYPVNQLSASECEESMKIKLRQLIAGSFTNTRNYQLTHLEIYSERLKDWLNVLVRLIHGTEPILHHQPFSGLVINETWFTLNMQQLMGILNEMDQSNLIKSEMQQRILEWCRNNGYTEPQKINGTWYAFPPQGVIPIPINLQDVYKDDIPNPSTPNQHYF